MKSNIARSWKFLVRVWLILWRLWTKPPKPSWWVNIYLHDLGYGGSEEGGWYFDTYEWIKDSPHNREFTDESKARAYYDYLRENVLPELNKGRRDITSVLSEGQYTAIVTDEPPVEFYPPYRPHYE